MEQSTLIDILRTARGCKGRIAKLSEGAVGSQELALKAALAQPDFHLGSSELIAAYGNINRIVGRKGALTFQAKVEHIDNNLHVTNLQVIDIGRPTADLATEVLETANQVVENVMNGETTKATAMLSALTTTIHTNPKIAEELRFEMDMAGLANTPWYKRVLEANNIRLIANPAIDDELAVEDQSAALRGLIEQYQSIVRDKLDEAIPALSASKNLSPSLAMMASDVLRDANRLTRVLATVDESKNNRELASIVGVADTSVATVVAALDFITTNLQGNSPE